MIVSFWEQKPPIFAILVYRLTCFFRPVGWEALDQTKKLLVISQAINWNIKLNGSTQDMLERQFSILGT